MKKLYLILIASLISVIVYGQITPFEVIPYITRGINLGNTLEPPSEGQWLETDPEEWSDNGPAQEYYFDAYRDAGFQSVRIPVTWHTHTLEVPPYTVDTTWMQRVEEIVDWALERDLYVILNAHHESWLKQDCSVENKERFDSIWSQVSTYFQDKPESLMFEILNEPHGLTLVEINEINARVLGIMRRTNPTRIVMFSGNGWANVTELIYADIPDDDYLIGYYHSYEPWSFAGLGTGTWGTESDIFNMGARMDIGQEWVEQNNIPLVISEFGADTACDYNSKMLFLAYYVEDALKRNFAFNVWDDGGTFQVYRRNSNSWQDTKDIIINYSEINPNQLVLSTDDELYDIHVAWSNRLENTDSIQVERRMDGGVFNSIATVGGTDSIFVDASLTPEDYYYYRIKAFRNDSVFYSYPQRMLLNPKEYERQPFSGNAIEIPGSIQVENFDRGGYNLSYYEHNFDRTTELYRDEKGVDIDLVNNSYALVDNENGEWFDYSVSVEETAEYEVTFYVESLNDVGRVGLYIGDNSSIITMRSDEQGLFLSAYSDIMTIEAGEYVAKLKILLGGIYTIDSIGIQKYIAPVGLNDAGIEINENPVKSFVTVTSKTNPIADVSIYSADGMKVFEAKKQQLPYECNVEEFAAGLYYVQVATSQKNTMLRFVKE